MEHFKTRNKTFWTVLFVLLISLPSLAAGPKNVTLKLRNATLVQALQELRKQADAKFIYSDRELKSAPRVTVEANNVSVGEAMNLIFRNQPFCYELNREQVYVIKPLQRNSQQRGGRTISGKIVDAKTGEPLIGASVFDTKSKLGGITGADGTFTITLPANCNTIDVTYIGYDLKRLSVDDDVLVIMLNECSHLLSDVVVIGYGQKTRGSLTSAISSIDKNDLQTLSSTATSMQNLLAGTVKGVSLVQSNGQPGATPKINVRGITSPYPNSINYKSSNNPLFVVDGIALFVDENQSMNPLQNISPNDIESIDVLKDAAATAIYGSRGANGVIIIKTKGGMYGEKTTVEAGYSLTISNPIKTYRILNNAEYLSLQDEVLRGTVLAAKYDKTTAFSFYPNVMEKYGNFTTDENGLPVYNGLKKEAFGTYSTNWEKEIRNRNAATSQYNISIRGGSELSNYSASFNAINQQGTYKNNSLDNYTGRISFNTQLFNRVQFGVLTNYSYSKQRSTNTEIAGTPTYRARVDIAPFASDGTLNRFTRDESGELSITAPSPLGSLLVDTRNTQYQFSASAFADVDIWGGLKFHTDFSYMNDILDNRSYSPLGALDDLSYYGIDPKATLNTSKTKTTNTTVNFRLDYTGMFAKHSFNAMVGYEADRNRYESSSTNYESFASDILNQPSSAKAWLGGSDELYTGGLNSIYGRLSYSFDDRYFVDASLRFDESSKFGPHNRWATFPAVSLAWKINNEAFLRDSSDVDDLKLRLSWGQTGSTNVADFSYRQYYEMNDNIYDARKAITMRSLLSNEDLKWEKTSEINMGLDFSLFNNKLFGSIDAYYRYTKGALAPAPFALESGMDSYFANVIDMSNKGIELSVGSDIVKTKDFLFSSVLNFSINRSKIKRLNGATVDNYFTDAFIEGQPLGVMKGFEVLGIAQNEADVSKWNEYAKAKGKAEYDRYLSVGQYIYRDINGDGTISTEDRTIIANPEPKFFGGWSNTIKYKNFSLSAMFQFSVGGQADYNALVEGYQGPFLKSVVPELYGRTWTPERPNAQYPMLVAFGLGSRGNNRSVFDTSYFRFKNITLKYTLPTMFCKKLSAESISLFLSATNLFTITKWPGIDPETLGSGPGPLYMASNRDPYPLSKSYSIGVNLKF